MEFRLIKMWSLVLVTASFLCFGVGEGKSGYTVPSTCEPITVPLCRSLPYNITRLPNLLGHSTQKAVEESIMAGYAKLINSSCSDSLVFLVCVYHLPICTMPEFKTPILPCRSLCHKVKHDCMPIIRQFRKQRSRRNVDCNNWPAYESGVCMTPESFIPQDDTCDCTENSSLSRRKFQARGYKFAIKAKVTSIVKIADVGRNITVKVRKVLKEGSVRIPRGTMSFYDESSCDCPTVKRGRVYLIVGHEDVGSGTPLLNMKSFVRIWNKKSFPGPLRNLIITWEARRRKKYRKFARRKYHKGN